MEQEVCRRGRLDGWGTRTRERERREGDREEEEGRLCMCTDTVYACTCMSHCTLPTTAVALSEVMGRKMAIIIGGVIFTIGGALQTASFFLWLVQD